MGPKGLPSLAFTILLVIIRTTAFSNNAELNSYQTISLLGKTPNNCVCFKIHENKKKVTSILSPTTSYKRLVIYLYQDNYSNNVYLYIPNQDKQRLFPNLNIEDDDILTLTTKMTLLPDVEYNPNSIELNHDKVSEGEGKIIKDLLSINDVYSPENSGEDQNYIPEYPSHISDGQHYPVNSLDIDSPLWIKPPQHAENIQDYDSSDDFNSPFESPPFVSDGIQFPVNSDSGILDVAFSQKQQSPVPYESDNERESLDPGVYDSHIPNLAKPKNLKFLEMYIKKNPEQPGSNIIRIKNKYRQQSHNPPFFINDDKNAPFKRWLNQQMENINEKPNGNINRNVEENVQKVLRENGITITSSGALLNQYGELLDPRKLQIRPILIGDSIQYQRLMAELRRSSNLPLDLPYLHALIISYIDRTPKVLGVVPIRKVYLIKKTNVRWWGSNSYLPASGHPLRSKELSNDLYGPYKKPGATHYQQESLPVQHSLQIRHRPHPVLPTSISSRGRANINQDVPRYFSGQFINGENGNDVRSDYSQKRIDQEDITDNIQDIYGTGDLDSPYQDLNYESESEPEGTPAVHWGESRESEINDDYNPENDGTVNYGDAISREISDGAIDIQYPSEAVNPETVYQGAAAPQRALSGPTQLDGRPQNPNYRRNLLSKLLPAPWKIFEKLLPSVFKPKSAKEKPEASEESEEEEDEPGFRIIGGSPATGSGAPLSSRGRSGYD